MLEDYYNNHGNTDIPCNYEIDGCHLGVWVSTQRQAYNGTISYKITKDRIMLLNDLGFDWSKKDTCVLKAEFSSKDFNEYKKIMLKRMKHILEDLSYETDGKIDNIDKQKSLENPHNPCVFSGSGISNEKSDTNLFLLPSIELSILGTSL